MVRQRVPWRGRVRIAKSLSDSDPCKFITGARNGVSMSNSSRQGHSPRAVGSASASRMTLKGHLFLVAAALSLPAAEGVAQSLLPKPPARVLGAPTPVPAYRPIRWDALVPPGWDAMKGFDKSELAALDDADPRAAAVLKRMREAWDRAPVNVSMIGQPVRIAGYVVPLDDSSRGLREFLLVPTYGACIHTPPPPSNQIIHVIPRVPARGVKTMDTVWVSGVLSYSRNESEMGTSSWSLPAVDVQPYTDSPQSVPRR